MLTVLKRNSVLSPLMKIKSVHFPLQKKRQFFVHFFKYQLWTRVLKIPCTEKSRICILRFFISSVTISKRKSILFPLQKKIVMIPLLEKKLSTVPVSEKDSYIPIIAKRKLILSPFL